MLADVVTTAASWSSEHAQLTYFVSPTMEAEVRPGQLVAVPYGERLVEGVLWRIHRQDDASALDPDTELRPLHTIIDPQPALLPHQMALAEWMAEYYVTSLAQVALTMLPPGLVQRSRYVLQLVESDEQALDEIASDASPRLRALIGLLLSDGEIDIARLQEMLGKKKTRELLKEIKAHNQIERTAQLDAPRVRPRIQRVVHIVAQGATLAQWREQKEQQLQSYLAIEPDGRGKGMGEWEDGASRLPDLATTSAKEHREVGGWGDGLPDLAAAPARGRKDLRPDPWALPAIAQEPQDKESQAIQRRLSRQLAAINLLEQSVGGNVHWTPNKLCKASGLTQAQLRLLVQERIVAIEETEIRRDPLKNRAIIADAPLQLTRDQQQALDDIMAPGHHHTPILLHGITGSGKTEIYLQALAAVIAQGKRGIVLVPEIALTTQAVQRVAARFPQRVAIIHSELGAGERYDEWRRIRSGAVDVVIGSRSALF